MASRLLLTVAVVAGCAVGLSGQADHIVGANRGWNPNINYTLWSGNQTFFVGDLICKAFPSTSATIGRRRTNLLSPPPMAPPPEPHPNAHLWAQATAIQSVRSLVPVVLDFKSNVFPKWRTFFTIAVTTYALEDHLTTTTPPRR